VSNVVLVAGKQPQWQHHCQECFACLHHYPQQAIQIGNKTGRKQRYQHPNVTLKELMANHGINP
jgi:epoxyqueuosine reductase QueG